MRITRFTSFLLSPYITAILLCLTAPESVCAAELIRVPGGVVVRTTPMNAGITLPVSP